MSLEGISTALLAVAAIISLLAVIASWFRPRGDEERQLDKAEDAIRRKQQELPVRQQVGGYQRMQQVSNDIELVRREILKGPRG